MRFGGALISGLLLLMAVAPYPGGAADAQPTEYQLKAAFLYHFAQFVDWPASAFPEAASPIVIGVLGQSPFGADLEQIISGKSINNRPLMIKAFRSVSEATNGCHILFVSSSEKGRLTEIFSGLRGLPVLTVGETDRFTESGGMINFVNQAQKIRFQINEEAAKAAGLKLSSKLLSLASRAGH